MGTATSGPQTCGRSRRGSIFCRAAVLLLPAGELDVVTSSLPASVFPSVAWSRESYKLGIVVFFFFNVDYFLSLY